MTLTQLPQEHSRKARRLHVRMVIEDEEGERLLFCPSRTYSRNDSSPNPESECLPRRIRRCVSVFLLALRESQYRFVPVMSERSMVSAAAPLTALRRKCRKIHYHDEIVRWSLIQYKGAPGAFQNSGGLLLRRSVNRPDGIFSSAFHPRRR